MDCLFNKFIPPSTTIKIILPPIGKTFINGISPGYEFKYDPVLENYISEVESKYIFEKLNDEIVSLWPCCYCFSYGYIFGLSFICPCICMSEVKANLYDKIKDLNNRVFLPKNLQLSYHSKCSTSWLELEILIPDHISIDQNLNPNSYNKQIKKLEITKNQT